MSDELYEKADELFQSDPSDALVCDDVALSHFFIWLEETIGRYEVQKYINTWLETKDGKAFYERAMESLMDNMEASNRDRDDIGSDR